MPPTVLLDAAPFAPTEPVPALDPPPPPPLLVPLVPLPPAPPLKWMLLVLPDPPAPADWPVAAWPAWAVTVTESPGKLVAVPVPPEPIVKVYVLPGVTARVVSSAYSPPPPPPPEWEPLTAVPPLWPSPQQAQSIDVTPEGACQVPEVLNVTVVMTHRPPRSHA